MGHHCKLSLLNCNYLISPIILLHYVFDVPNLNRVILTRTNKLISSLWSKVHTANVFIMAFKNCDALYFLKWLGIAIILP